MIDPPSSADTLRKNPLGLYVDAVDWSRELEPGAAATPPTSRPTAAATQAPSGLPLGSPLDPSSDQPQQPQTETDQ